MKTSNKLLIGLFIGIAAIIVLSIILLRVAS
jgi:hypothetical protein